MICQARLHLPLAAVLVHYAHYTATAPAPPPGPPPHERRAARLSGGILYSCPTLNSPSVGDTQWVSSSREAFPLRVSERGGV